MSEFTVQVDAKTYSHKENVKQVHTCLETSILITRQRHPDDERKRKRERNEKIVTIHSHEKSQFNLLTMSAAPPLTTVFM